MLKSIRARLMAWHLVVTALLFLVFSLALYASVAHSLYLEIDVTLLSKADELISYAHTGQIDFGKDQIAFSTDDLLIQVSQLDGTVLHKSPNLHEERLPLDVHGYSQGPKLQTISLHDGTSVRLLTNLDTTEEGDPVFVQVATPLRRVSSALGRLRFWLLALAPVVLGLASVGSYFLADRMLRPLRTMTQTAKTISAGNLSQRLPVTTPTDEIGQLATTFNQMFERLHQAFEHQRRFVSNASHELRTPLTVLRGQLEVALRKARSPEEYRQTLQTALTQAERLSRLTEQLLLLARTESAGWISHRKPVRLDRLALEVCQELRPLAEHKQLLLETACSSPIVVQGDAELLRQAIFNLLDNAIKYTPAGGRVRLSLEQQEGRAQLIVADTGVGIPPDDLPHIFERFYRVDKARSVGGVGLGLALVREIITQHQGEIQVASVLHHGTTFTVSLPQYPQR